jgi:hypothetical protein
MVYFFRIFFHLQGKDAEARAQRFYFDLNVT